MADTAPAPMWLVEVDGTPYAAWPSHPSAARYAEGLPGERTVRIVPVLVYRQEDECPS